MSEPYVVIEVEGKPVADFTDDFSTAGRVPADRQPPPDAPSAEIVPVPPPLAIFDETSILEPPAPRVPEPGSTPAVLPPPQEQPRKDP
jgi:hypothetical protein